MMRAPSVFLFHEIFRNDALAIAQWLKNPKIVQYLNEIPNVCDVIEETLERTQLPVLTYLFNRHGRFLMIANSLNERIGFVKLIPKPHATEMIVVIGKTDQWGKGFGTGAIQKSVQLAFFEWRTPQVVAKIHPDNHRSIRAFSSAGFRAANKTGRFYEFCLTFSEYLDRTGHKEES